MTAKDIVFDKTPAKTARRRQRTYQRRKSDIGSSGTQCTD